MTETALITKLMQELHICCSQIEECMEQNTGRIWDNANVVLGNARALFDKVEREETQP